MQVHKREAFAVALLIVLLTTGAAVAVGQENPNIENGRAIAAANCSQCHAIAERDVSPTRTNAETAFRDLHRRFPIEMLVDAGRSGIIEGHDEMPEFVFSRTEIGDLLAYIDYLAPEQSGKYTSPER